MRSDDIGLGDLQRPRSPPRRSHLRLRCCDAPGQQNLLAFASSSCKLILSDLSPVECRGSRQRSLGVTTRSAGLFLFPSMPNEGRQGQFKTDYRFAPPAVAGSVYPFSCTSAGRHSCRCARPRTRVCFARLFYSIPSALRGETRWRTCRRGFRGGLNYAYMAAS